MVSTVERYGWAAVFAVLIAFAIPWFLWGDSRMAAGLPVWLWWHVGWMVLAAVAFWAFAVRAWGIGVVTQPDGGTAVGPNGGTTAGPDGGTDGRDGRGGDDA